MTDVVFKNSTSHSQTGGTSAEFSFDVEDGNFVIVRFGALLGQTYVVKCGGVTMFPVLYDNPGFSRILMTWVLLNPPTGVQDITIDGQDIGGGGTFLATAESYGNVSSGAYFLVPVHEAADSSSPTATVAIESGCMVSAACWARYADQTLAQGASQTSREYVELSDFRMRVSTSTVAENTFTLSVSTIWAIQAIALRPVGSSGVVRPLPGNMILDPKLEAAAELMITNVGVDHADWIATGDNYTVPASGAGDIAYEQSDSSYYHDGTLAMYGWGDYRDEYLETSGAAMRTAAQQQLEVIIDGYYNETPSFPLNLDSYKPFPRGPYRDFQIRGEVGLEIETVLLNMRDNPSYAGDASYLGPTLDTTTKERECSYSLANIIYADRIGITPGRPERRADLVDWCIDWLDHYFVREDWVGIDVVFANFQVSYLCWVLIEELEDNPSDSRILPAIRTACDSMWENYWQENAQSWNYNNNPDSSLGGGVYGAPDLAMLIAPIYAWLAVQDNSQAQMDRADYGYAGLAQGGSITPGKHFNQMTVRMPEYLEWRNAFYTGLSTTVRRKGGMRRRGMIGR
jgi:hypothetical protein